MMSGLPNDGGQTMAERAMPSFSKSPPELVERFGEVMQRYPEAVQRKMFGYPAAFVGGNMATSLFHDRWVVRLAEGEIEAATAAGAGPFEPMAGKPMKGFVVIPIDDVADDARLTQWVERGLARARSMPPKK
jgi:TfoX/Sxy family transcriptional regulator of competence genes